MGFGAGFFVAAFFTAFLAGAFAAVFFTAAFFGAAFLGAAFLGAAFLAAAFFGAAFLLVTFLVAISITFQTCVPKCGITILSENVSSTNHHFAFFVRKVRAGAARRLLRSRAATPLRVLRACRAPR